jgi:hypothetical protein
VADRFRKTSIHAIRVCRHSVVKPDPPKAFRSIAGAEPQGVGKVEQGRHGRLACCEEPGKSDEKGTEAVGCERARGDEEQAAGLDGATQEDAGPRTTVLLDLPQQSSPVR